MNFHPKINKALRDNWGEKADCLACDALVRLFDEHSGYQCFLIAQGPDDEYLAIVCGFTVYIDTIYYHDILSQYNERGEGLKIDGDFRPIESSRLLKKLKKERHEA